MRRMALALAVAAAAGTLGGCKVSPENDPHNLPYIVFPADSPGVMQYSTNPYPAATAPPLWGPAAGGRD